MFKTYKASAGSGKTTSLVAEYLFICLQNPQQYRHVLAITFTNNATAEMKDRIVSTLNRFAFDAPEDWDQSTKAIRKLMVDLQKSLKDDKESFENDKESFEDDRLIAERSRELLGNILYDYPNFSISTIDSFFQRIVRAFAFELNISMNFELEVTLDDYYAQTIDVLYNRISEQAPELKDRITNLVFRQMDNNGKWRIDDLLLKDLNVIYGDESAAISLNELEKVENLDTIVRQLASGLRAQRDEILKIVKDAKEYIRIQNLDVKQCTQGKNGIYSWFMKFSPEEYHTNSYIESFVSGEKYCVKKDVAGYVDIHDSLMDFHRRIVELQLAYIKRYSLLRNVESLSILFDLKNVMDEIRERDNKFFLSDTNFKIYNEIKNEDSDFLFEKIGNRYSYFFIDEFQDTSKMQWDDLVPLLHNVLASGNTKAILFGDVKQAIYRFRNGESKLFADLTSDLSDPEKAKEYLRLCPNDKAGGSKKYQPLIVNYRSGEKIVEFNNEFFSKLTGYEGFPASAAKFYADYYQKIEKCKDPESGKDIELLSVQQHSSKADGAGLVQIRFNGGLEFGGTEPDGDDDGESPNADAYQDHYVYESVKDALARGYSCRDIAILTSSRSAGSRLARMLATHPEQSFSVISSDSLLLASSPEVNLVVAAMRYLLDPTDKLNCLNLICLYLRHQNSETPETLAKATQSIAQIEKDCDCSPALSAHNIHIDRDVWLRQPLFSLVHLIVQDFHLDATNAFLISFLDNCLDYTSKQVGELGPFLDWWDNKSKKLALSSPEGIDAITISTIHKSKGLQYPVVILPLNEFGNRNTKSNFWYEPSKEDDVPLPRLLVNTSGGSGIKAIDDVCDDETAQSYMDSLNKIYVAHTRPKDMLYIITGPNPNSKIKMRGNYNKMLYAFLKDKDIKPREGDEFLYFIGKEDWKKPASGTAAKSVEEQSIPAVEKMYVSSFAASSLHVVSGKEESEAQSIGNVVHDFLAKLRVFPQTEAEVAAMEIPSGIEYAGDIRQALLKIVRNPEILPYFAPGLKVLNEVSIIRNADEESAGGQLVFRPDRVVCLPDETIVIDYKTGHPTEQMMYEYEKQVDNYVQLLTQMKFPHVTGKIIYL